MLFTILHSLTFDVFVQFLLSSFLTEWLFISKTQSNANWNQFYLYTFLTNKADYDSETWISSSFKYSAFLPDRYNTPILQWCVYELL